LNDLLSYKDIALNNINNRFLNQKNAKKWLQITLVASLFSHFSAFAGTPEFKRYNDDVSTFSDYREPQQTKQGLAQALQATMNNHPAIHGNRAELNGVQYAIDTAEAGRYPSLNAQAGNVSDDNGQATLRLDQPVWAFGKIDASIDYANANYEAQKVGLLQLQRQLIEDTASAYAKIEGIKQRELVALANIEEHQNLYQRIERRQKGQLASQSDVRLAYSRLMQAKSQQQTLHGELLVAENDLLALTQIMVSTSMAVDPEFTLLPCCAPLEQLIVDQSADMLFKQQQLAVVRKELRQEELASTPTVYFRAEHDVGQKTYDSVDRTRVGLVIEGNLNGMGFAAIGRVNSAKSRLKAAQFDINNTANDVRRRANTLLLNRSLQMDLLTSQQLTVEAISATRESFLRQYDTGRKSWIELLNTQREFTEERLQLAQIQNDVLILSLRLATLTGSLDLAAGIQNDDQ
jgi:adhesin transport system outer membrane protein